MLASPPRSRPHRRTARLASSVVLAAGLVASLTARASATVPTTTFVAVGGLADGNAACDTGRTATTADSATTWQAGGTAFDPTPGSLPSCIGGGELFDVARRGTIWLAVGTKVLSTGSSQGVAFRSTDAGAHWTPVGTTPATPPGTTSLEAVASDGAGRWVAGGYHGLYLSTDDGASWAAASGTAISGAFQVHDIAEQPGATSSWAAVGSKQPPAPALRTVFLARSTTGATWTDAGGISTSRETQLNGVAIDATGRKVAVGSTHLPTDPSNRLAPMSLVMPATGSTWAPFDQPRWTDTTAGGLNGVATDGAGTWLAVGTRGEATPDAVVRRATNPVPGGGWIDRSAGLPSGTSQLQAVATDKQGTWVVVGGDKGSVSRSTDGGTSWSAEVQTIGAQTGRGLLRSVAVRPGSASPATA